MEKLFEYIKVQTAMDSFNVADIGNVIMQACNDDGLEWYLYIETKAGYSTVKEFGPLMGDNETVPKNNFNYSCYRAEYNEKSLCKIINNFLNNPKRAITQVDDIDIVSLKKKFELIKNIL